MPKLPLPLGTGGLLRSTGVVDHSLCLRRSVGLRLAFPKDWVATMVVASGNGLINGGLRDQLNTFWNFLPSGAERSWSLGLYLAAAIVTQGLRKSNLSISSFPFS